MKKLFISIFTLLIASVYIFGDIQRDTTTKRYYTIPTSLEINQATYHDLVWQCKDILNAYSEKNRALLAQFPGAIRSSAYDPNNNAGKAAVVQYLERLATPTSIRLLEDLKKINFIIPA